MQVDKSIVEVTLWLPEVFKIIPKGEVLSLFEPAQEDRASLFAYQ